MFYAHGNACTLTAYPGSARQVHTQRPVFATSSRSACNSLPSCSCLDAVGRRTSLAIPCTLPPGSQRRHLEKLHKLMAEWGFKDLATAEAYYRRTLRQKQGETRKKLEVGLWLGLGATVPTHHRCHCGHVAMQKACHGQPFAAAHAYVRSAATDAVLGSSNERT